MENKNKLWIGISAFWLFFALEIVTDIWFGSQFPGYNWKTQSISYLGQSGSPLEQWVLLWGIFFSVLLTIFAFAFHQFYKSRKWVTIATGLLIIYALGEGVGSGCFPVDPAGTMLTINGRLHNIFGGIGDAGLVLFPFALMLMFPKAENQKFYVYLLLVIGTSFLMSSFFLTAKYFHPDNFITEFKGVWQRLYLLNYYLMLLIISGKMTRQISSVHYY